MEPFTEVLYSTLISLTVFLAYITMHGGSAVLFCSQIGSLSLLKIHTSGKTDLDAGLHFLEYGISGFLYDVIIL